VFNSGGASVALGDVVRVTGPVSEYFELTEITATTVEVCQTGASVTPTPVTLPAANATALERTEGMLVSFAQNLVATETYNQGRYGEVTLSVNARLSTPTNVVAPGVPAQNLQTQNLLASIQLDDGSNVQNPAIAPYVAADGTLRIGDKLSGLTGVLSFGFGVYEVHPTASVVFTRNNPRTAAPADPGGQFQVAALNVLNYFTTLDTGAAVCGPSGGLDCRGANTASEFTRQRTKLLAAISAINSDIIGLVELENNASASIADIVSGLNSLLGSGTYTYVNTGTIGTDAIKVGLIYKPAKVTTVGTYKILDSSVNPAFIDTRNRPVLAQTFRHTASNEVLTVAVNHLKSKGSACSGDPDTGDGQGNCNQTRVAAALAEANWLASDPTFSGDPDYLILGDLNAYAKEDPITTFTSNGLVNLISTFLGPLAYSYVFEGQAGYLDHALASASLASKVAGVTEWHINSDEPRMLDYNQEFNPPSLYQPNQYRVSDHDPVIVGIGAGATPVPAPFPGGFAPSLAGALLGFGALALYTRTQQRGRRTRRRAQ
jgi:predicted extracellular nuclease